ncbi:MaoC/PaaZ C-terminal domain-containing protein [Brachybacterium kimchii]|uniref:Acyl dehydratase n=1 Tax=Brachybacterium kimchii TaxID=2942909 RepID=A0ABY4N6W5_9MICO|nr:MaoC/PaaZ C-terminal domain-containing protein [Brachybacterium kimchii]UQN29821.1 acyl dehydratase [Brachybacterium kimchii]
MSRENTESAGSVERTGSTGSTARKGKDALQQGERIRDLADVPSFPAVYAAALSRRPGARRSRELPEVAHRVRRVRIDPARAAAFDHLMGGAATDLVHPGVLHVLAFPVSLSLMARSDFPVGLLGLVHTENRLLQHRPVRVGELVDVECRTRDLRPHRRGRTFEAVTTFLSADGEIVATDVSTYLAKGGGEGSGSGEGAGPGSRSGSGEGSSGRSRRDFVPPAPTGRWHLDAGTGRRYAEVSGDANPIHMSALSARAFGFPRAIAHGMFTASRAFTESRPDLTRPLQWDVRFEAPVTLPGTVLVRYEDDEDGTTRCVGWKSARSGKPARRHFTLEVSPADRG